MLWLLLASPDGAGVRQGRPLLLLLLLLVLLLLLLLLLGPWGWRLMLPGAAALLLV
jgi:hypothetical protein